MRYIQLRESSVRDLNLNPDLWRSQEVELNDRNLDSLDGCPDEVLGSLYCGGNRLTSLAHAPKIVGRNFGCANNLLTSLVDCPQDIGGYFNCAINKLTSLASGPKDVGGGFYCSNNQLTSLVGCPSTVGNRFVCTNNLLVSLADIHIHLKQMKGSLLIGGNPIISHLLGVLLIRGCTDVCYRDKYKTIDDSLKQAVDILNRYMGRGRTGIMDCQAEMLAAGLDDFAQI